MTIAESPLNESVLAEEEADFTKEDVFVFPVSFAQQRLWFLDQFEPNSPFYNIPLAVRLNGRLDVTILEQVLNEIVRRHEILRTTFSSLNGDPIQLITEEGAISLPVIDLRSLPKSEKEYEALRLANEEAKRPFNLTTGPLLRAHLYWLDEAEYVAIFVMHHIISDGWSMGVLIREISILYAAFAAGRPSPLPELPIQYADFAHWQREWLKDDVLQGQLDFWTNQLGGDLPVLELPTDRPRPAVQSSRGASLSHQLSPDLTSSLNNLCKQEGVTLFMTLLAAFQTLLYRYSDQETITVGSPIANRNRGEIEGLIGFFVNTLVFRADLRDDLTFRDLLTQVRETTLGAYAHQDLPFEMLVEALQPDRDMSHTPLFQVMFILQNAPSGAQELPGLSLDVVDVETGTATFDITLSMTEIPGQGMDASVEFCTDMFERASMERMLVHFETLLTGIVNDPDQAIAKLPLITETERHQLLFEWNETAERYSLDQCVHQLFEAQVEQTPQDTAVVWQNQRLTYIELNQRANQLAHHLRELGVSPETLVAVCLERSLEMIVAVLGILKAGGAYVPLDPTYPTERLSFMLADSAAPILLTQANLVETLPSTQAKLISLDSDWDTIAQQPTHNLPNQNEPHNLVYMIYTSGSTGKSKGVMIEHRNLVNAYFAWEESYNLHQVHSHLQMANFAFDVFSGDLVRGLLSGGKLVLCPREWLLSPDKLYDLMSREEVDIAEFVPVVLRHLAQYLEAESLNLSFMRILACGSDNWYVGEYKRFLQYCGPETRLINSFGLTEATIDSTYFEADLLDLSTDQIVPIGRPFANTHLYILDRQLQPLPIGIPGELVVGGAGVARGYFNRPELTAERFVPLSVSGDQHSVFSKNSLNTDNGLLNTVYRTGDKARYLPDGNVEFLGRIDHQVKIRGFRIEPGEIEAALGEHTAVRQAAVMPLEAAAGDKRLVAYVVTRPENQPTIGTLRRFLQKRLPDYMVPSTFILLAEMPLLPNGKVDRRSLPEPDWSQRELESAYVAPRNPVEEVLVNVWQQVLGLRQVGIHDNFFELGGHSLLATQLISRVQDAFDIDLPLRHIFEAPTAATLAEFVEIAQRAEAGTQAPPIEPIPREAELPLSFAQQRLWFLDQLEPNSPFYNIPEAVQLTGKLDETALARALNEVVRRHEALRTTFSAQDGRPFQQIAADLKIELPVIDLTHLPETNRQTEALQLAQEEAQRPFDLSRGPLVRATLLRLAPDDHIILLTMHHIIGDNWSTGVLVQEMAVLYDAFSNGRFSPLPQLPIQYADFAHWQRNWLHGDVLQTHLTYWTEQLSGSPPVLALPTDRPRPAVQTYDGAYQAFSLSETLSAAIRRLCQQEGVTTFMALLAAFQTLLYRYTGQEDINVGSPIANRNRADIEGLIGFFVNTLVFRGDLSGEPSFRELLQRVRDAALGAYAHQDLPFEMIVDALQPERNLSHSPLFQVMFVIQNTQMQQSSYQSSPDLIINPVEAHSGTAKFDLTLFMLEEDEKLGGAWEYNTDLFDQTTIERMMQQFEVLLASIVADPDRPISQLPLLTEGERQKLLLTWNDTVAAYPHDQCVHQLFEAQVEKSPNAIAVQFEDQALTYAELNGRANQLAHYLRKLGVQAESLVGICAERSLEMVVGLLGVLKAGGAYIPLDPTYPPERLNFMLHDAEPAIVLSQQHLASNLQLPAPQLINLDSDWPTIALEAEQNPVNLTQPENLAYIIYTSGSTGQPKGTMLLHRGLVNYLTWCLQAYPVSEGQGAPVHSSISFDLTITGLYAPLLAGRRVHILPEDIGIEQLSDALRHNSDFSLVKITPAHLNLLTQQLSPNTIAGRTRSFVIGGENLLAESLTFWQEHAPDTILINEYGPTETVVGCCVYQVPPEERWEGSVPIGRPIINTRLYILDKHLQPVPIGVPGELYIGGAGVARGYLNRPALSAESFIVDPFAADSGVAPDGAKLYKTGDLCRYLPDGNIEFLGRLDHQVKIHGFRIELGEIEAVLNRHPAVQKSAVIDQIDETENKRLVAYLVMAEEIPNTTILREFLGTTLPPYMIPAAFVTLDEIPLTANGKVDRQALPAPEASRPEMAVAFAAPQTENEKILADIWAKLLGVEKIGIHDSFFELGGDSILSIQVIARANQAGLRLTPRQIFQEPTIAGLAAIAGSGPMIEAEQGLVTGPVALTPIQYWFFEQGQPAPNHWNQSLLLTVKESLDGTLLAAAVSQLISHHDALRLRFHKTEAGWQQENAGLPDEIPFELINLSEIPTAECAAVIEEKSNQLQTSLNLENGPLLRVAYFDLGRGRPGRLLIIIHHLAVDGVSWRILLEDLQTAYQQLLQNQPPQLPPKTTSFQHWANRIEDYAQSESLQLEADWWTDVLNTSDGLLPRDYGETAVVNREESSSSVTVSLSREETEALLRDAHEAYRTEINDFLLTALAQAFHHWTGNHSLLVNLEGHGREDLFATVDISRTIGWFTTLYPVRLSVENIAAPGRALMAVKEQLRQIPNRGIGYGLLRYLNRDKALGKKLADFLQPEVSFNYLGQMDQVATDDTPFGLAAESGGSERDPHSQRTHLLEIDGGIMGGQLQLEWTFNDGIHKPETINTLAQDYIKSLRALIEHALSPEAGGVTLSDVAEFGWEKDDLDDILAAIEDSF